MDDTCAANCFRESLPVAVVAVLMVIVLVVIMTGTLVFSTISSISTTVAAAVTLPLRSMKRRNIIGENKVVIDMVYGGIFSVSVLNVWGLLLVEPQYFVITVIVLIVLIDPSIEIVMISRNS